MAQEFTVLDMTCQGCAATVRHVVERIPGVESVDIDLPTHKVRVNAASAVPSETIVTALNKAGYDEITAR
jgi:copper chaperone CopZ